MISIDEYFHFHIQIRLGSCTGQKWQELAFTSDTWSEKVCGCFICLSPAQWLQQGQPLHICHPIPFWIYQYMESTEHHGKKCIMWKTRVNFLNKIKEVPCHSVPSKHIRLSCVIDLKLLFFALLIPNHICLPLW